MRRRKLVFIFLTIIVFVIGSLLFWYYITIPAEPGGVMGSTEAWKTYEYPQDNLTISALEGVSEEMIEAAHEYIIFNNYNDQGITYGFVNSLRQIEFPHLYDTHENNEWVFHIMECYNEAFTDGGFWMNRQGEVIEDHGYFNADELSIVDTEIGISYDDAKAVAKSAVAPSYTHYYDGFCYRKDNTGRIIYCYYFVFAQDHVVYVDAGNGEIVQSVTVDLHQMPQGE